MSGANKATVTRVVEELFVKGNLDVVDEDERNRGGE